jgi:K+-transporting ATPase KdpF subunit
MKTKIKISFVIPAIVPHSDAATSNGPVSYILGGIIALLILGYLIYTLLRPDKF